jgi:type I restriction enzyme S subunit
MSRSNTTELVGAVGRVHQTQGRILLCDKLYRIEFNESGIDPDFAVYLLRSQAARQQLERDASGASNSMKNISNERVADLVLAFPPVEEQQAIVAFLDRKTAEIDAVIAAKERMIGLLEEKRQALISQAVTRGLDPSVPMKDSGIEWLGSVPAHWQVCPLRRFRCLVQTGPFGSQLHAHDYIDGGTPVINPVNLIQGQIAPDPRVTVGPDILARLAHQRLRQGDIIFARRGELGRCAFVGSKEEGWLCGTGCMIVRLIDQRWEPLYLASYLSLPRLEPVAMQWR